MRSVLPALTDRHVLPCGLAVSPVCMGATDADTVVAGFDAGINFFFLSGDLHWPYYEGVRQGLRRLIARGVPRDAFVVAGTTYMTQLEFMRGPFIEILEQVPELERIDLVVAGGTYAADFPGRQGELAKMVESQRIGARGTGCTFHDRAPIADAINRGAIDVGFVRYNPTHAGARREVFPTLDPARRAKLYNFKSTIGADEVAALVAREPALDVWIPAMPDYYRFALSRPEIDGVLLALDGAAQIAALVEALAEGPLSADEQDHMIALIARARGR